MKQIEDYSFGRMVIDGKTYKSDLIVFPDGRVCAGWRRERGHVLTLGDLEELVAAQPDLIVIGTGALGIMKPDSDLASSLADRHIEFIAHPTSEAVRAYNQCCSSGRTGGCFHLTC